MPHPFTIAACRGLPLCRLPSHLLLAHLPHSFSMFATSLSPLCNACSLPTTCTPPSRLLRACCLRAPCCCAPLPPSLLIFDGCLLTAELHCLVGCLGTGSVGAGLFRAALELMEGSYRVGENGIGALQHRCVVPHQRCIMLQHVCIMHQDRCVMLQDRYVMLGVLCPSSGRFLVSAHKDWLGRALQCTDAHRGTRVCVHFASSHSRQSCQVAH